MLRNYQKYYNRIHAVLDMMIVALSYVLAWYLRFKSGLFVVDAWFLSLTTYMRALLYVVPLYFTLYYIFQLYTPKRVQGRRQEAWNVLQANVVGLLIIILFLYLRKQSDFSRSMLFLFLVINIFLDVLGRNIIRQMLRSYRKKGFNQRQILLVGYSRTAEQFIDRALSNPDWGYSIRGILDNHMERGTEYRGIKVIGSIDNLMIILPQNKLDEIAITLSIEEYKNLGGIVSACEKSGVHTKFIPDYNNIIPTRPYTEDLMGLPVINIRHVPLSDPFNMFVKRVVDLFGSMFAIVLFSPIMIVVALIIKYTSPGPLIFKQERVGLGNKPFSMYKFRSMVVQDARREKGEWTTPNDPRVTSIGRFIRRTSIDELPQLFNIVKGDMSLVGPRPERPFFVEKFREEIPRYMIKHQVRPGLTGWAQINGFRGDTSIRKRIDCDLYYIENWTLGLDFKIIILTFLKGFVNKNAY